MIADALMGSAVCRFRGIVMSEISVQSASPLVSVVILARDEEFNISDCLRSLAGLACEVFVVDSGSTDATVDIARRAGAETLAFRWPGGFPKKRNWVLQTYAFKTEWVLFLDADERLTPALAAHCALVRPLRCCAAASRSAARRASSTPGMVLDLVQARKPFLVPKDR